MEGLRTYLPPLLELRLGFAEASAVERICGMLGRGECPALEALHVVSAPAAVAAALEARGGHEACAGLRELTMPCGGDGVALGRALRSRACRALESLHLTRMARADAEAFGGWLLEGAGAGLQGLSCSTRRGFVRVDAVLVGLRATAGLRRLRLASFRVADPEGLASLAALVELEELELWHVDADALAYQRLAERLQGE
jgi:hypothetical protein